MRLALAAALGFALDAACGDPRGLPHPIILIGRLISRLEHLLRRVFPDTNAGELIAGCLLWPLTVGTSFAVTFGLLWLLGWVHPLLGFAAETFLCYQIFARRSLEEAGEDVESALGRSLEDGRRAVSMYVGRDTAALDEEGVIKAAVETIAENTNDGVIAPLLYMLLGGAPLAMAYKAVNTLDSMVGYHNERYEYFGKLSARLDDVFGFVPARLSALCMLLGAALLPGFDEQNALRIYLRDRAKHKSPNAGQTEAVCAGALRVRLAGDASYFGRTVKKASLGDPLRPIERSDIAASSRLMTAASVAALALGVTVRLIVLTVWYYGNTV